MSSNFCNNCRCNSNCRNGCRSAGLSSGLSGFLPGISNPCVPGISNPCATINPLSTSTLLQEQLLLQQLIPGNQINNCGCRGSTNLISFINRFFSDINTGNLTYQH